MRFLTLVLFAACAPQAVYKKSAEAPAPMMARPAANVELYFGVSPSKPHVIVGSFTREPSDYVNDSLFDLTYDFRRAAAHEGCDAVIVPTGEQIKALTKEAKEPATASCAMWTSQAAPASAPIAPEAASKS